MGRHRTVETGEVYEKILKERHWKSSREVLIAEMASLTGIGRRNCLEETDSTFVLLDAVEHDLQAGLVAMVAARYGAF